ncbi:hypothetical protein DMP23_47325 [Amycolatopsis sp. A1MSW2902]|uniref:hypothetical protein n=1 Tax=Amycolatopsis sp. A1MSW2902 TaxID=687413 RepID=UPI00307EE009
MKIFGQTVYLSPQAREAARQQRRAERNERAMTSQIGSADPDADVRFGYPSSIAQDEITFACELLVAARKETGGDTIDVESIRTALRRRCGAAAAVHAAPEFVPILAPEIDVLERAVALLEQRSWTWQHHLRLFGRELLDDLRRRQGHAEAVRYIGELPVF